MMISKIKGSLLFVLFIILNNIAICQVKLIINNNEEIIIANKQFIIPEIEGFEKKDLMQCQRDSLFQLRYYSHYATEIFILLQINNESDIFLKTILVVDPCQPCDPHKITSFEKQANISLAELTDDLLQKLVDSCTSITLNKRELIDEEPLQSFIDFESYFQNIKCLEIVASVDNIALYLKNYPINQHITAYNNIAYYLEQAGNYKESAFLLEEIIKEFPSRTVAYINLGDAYWGLKDHSKAKEAYKKYIELMKANGKEAKIPTKVWERIK